MNVPINLKFGMYIVLGKISRNRENNLKKKLPGGCSNADII